MSIILISLTFKITFTFSLSLVYLYLYWIYREKFMGIWSLSWSFFVIRLIFDFLRFKGFDNMPANIINQSASIISVYLLLVGTYYFIGRNKSKYWGIVAIIISVGTDIALFYNFPLYLCSIPTAVYFGIANILSGISFLRCSAINELGKKITGTSLMLLGILTFTYPLFAVFSSEYTALMFFAGSILEITIIMGTLLVYFQKVRDELLISESRFRLLAENAIDIIYRYNLVPQKEFDYISPSVSDILGYTPKMFYSDPELINEILSEEMKNDIRLLDNILSKQIITIQVKAQDERLVLTEQHIVPIFDESGVLIAIEGIIRDISERKKVEEEMIRIDQMRILGETAAGIAHEIRNPMTTVRGFIQLFMTKTGMEEFQEHFRLIIAELDRANEIITEFLSISKEKRANLKSRCLNDIILTIAPLLETNALVAYHYIQYDLGNIPNLMLDENEIRQLILNIVQNGIEAMKEQGSIKIRTYIEKDDVVLAISDQGAGIEQGILDKIGTPFITSKESGTGLGLVVCYSIAARHNAKINIDTGVSGTTMYIRFSI